MEKEQFVYAWLPKKLYTRFNTAVEGSNEDKEELILKWIFEYVESYEEDIAARKLYKNTPATNSLEDTAARKLHAEADKWANKKRGEPTVI